MFRVLIDFIDDESGATAIEYSLFAALVSVACIATLFELGSVIFRLFAPVEQVVHRCTQVGSNCGK